MAVQDMSYTSNPTRDYEFSWTVDNFSLTRDVLEGHSFSPIPGFPVHLRLNLQFKRLSYSDGLNRCAAALDLVLVLDSNAKTNKYSGLTFSGCVDYRDINGISLKTNTTYCSNFNGNFTLMNYTSKRFSDTVTKQSLSSTFNLQEDKLIVKGKLTFSGYDTATSSSSLTDKDNFGACGELLKDFKTIYESCFSSEITFLFGEKTLRAHKAVLHGRSPVFAKMFDSDMLEGNSNEVKIDDTDSHAFNCFLVFLYTGIVEDKTSETVLSLYSLAHKYQVTSLHRICSRILSKQLTVDSACSVVVLSDLHGDEELKIAAKAFIRRHLLQIVGTTEWVETVTTKPQLVKELLA